MNVEPKGGWIKLLADPQDVDAKNVGADREKPEPQQGPLDQGSSVRPGQLAKDGRSTEESIAQEWVANHSLDWRYDHQVGKWFHWDGAIWREDLTKLATQLIREHTRAAAALPVPGSKDQKPQSSLARASVVKGAELFCQIDQRIAVEHGVWNQDPLLLGTPAGTVDLQTGKLRTSDRSAMITRSTSVAPATGAPTRWLQFVDEATNGDAELARFLQIALGYCLTGSTQEHALFFAYGAGKNGKSVFLNTATRIMGDYAVTAAMDTFTASRGDKHPTELARLDGARLVAASETEEGRAWAESRIKQLTGGDRIAARFMRNDFFEFTPAFKLFIVGNFQPSLHNVDEATRRRFNIIPFIHTPAHPDPQLEGKLSREYPQILAWMIEGALLWQNEGLTRPDVVRAATDLYFEEQDLFGQWLQDFCTLRTGALSRPKELFESWRQFALDSGEEPGTQKAMAAKLRKQQIEPYRSGGIRFYRGVELRRGEQAT